MRKINAFLFLLLSFSGNICLGESQDYWKAEDYFENSSSQKSAAADLLKYVTIQKHGSLLDVGCGDGKITAEIAALIPDGSVIGVDISPAMIEFAQIAFPQSNFPNLKFFLKDAQKLDFNSQFDFIFSFTALQWVQNHEAFLTGAYKSLKCDGTLALTMPMGLPPTLELAVTELIDRPEWSSYFNKFSTGWNFIDDTAYMNLLGLNQFNVVRLAVVPQRDIFPSRSVFEKFISQWFPYLRPLPQNLKAEFLSKVIDRFLELEPPFPNGEVHFKIRRLEVIATKSVK
ncbi:MAG: methyltransferase domain-containing protein [Parachlamydiaceae bacterium]|nr:methyltransferase domain-containing protein [Parachlamydiaceae bacterium]